MTGAEPVTDGLADLTTLDETTLLSLHDLLVSVAEEVPGVHACVLTLRNSSGEAVLSSAAVSGAETVFEEGPPHPLLIDGEPVGALAFLQVTPVLAVDPTLIAHATGRVAGFLSAAPTLAERDREITQLTQAMETRTVIGQAAGLLMAQSSCRADTAMDALKRQSQHSNIKLRDVAIALVRAHEASLTEAAPTSASAATPETRAEPQEPGLPRNAEADPEQATDAQPRATSSVIPEPQLDPERRRQAVPAASTAPHPEPKSGQALTPGAITSRKSAALETVLVLHQGGPHAGRLRRISAASARQALVYDRDLAVYRPATPPQQVQTREGPAQLWICR